MSSITSSSRLKALNGSVKISGDDETQSPPPPPLTDSIDDHKTFLLPANSAMDIMENPNHHRHRAEHARDGPPLDDCCPICFGNFTIPCKSSCGHWYCGSCILQYWSHCVVTRPCKCPMCTRTITKLIPEASLHDRNEEDVLRVLEEVAEYNCLFIGGMRGVVQKVRRSPLFLRSMFLRLMDPDTPAVDFFLLESYLQLISTILITLFMALSVMFSPIGDPAGVLKLVDKAVSILVLILRVVGTYRRRQLPQRVREIIAIAVAVCIHSYRLL